MKTFKTLIIDSYRDFNKAMVKVDRHDLVMKYGLKEVVEADLILIKGNIQFIVYKDRYGDAGTHFIYDLDKFIEYTKKKKFPQLNAFEDYYNENYL